MPNKFGLSSCQYNTFFPAMLMITGVLMVASIDIYLPAAPYLKDLFKTTELAMQFSMMLGPIAASITGIFYGHWSDLSGRRFPLISSLFLFALGSALMTLAYNIESFILFRFLQAFGAGGLSVVSISVISDLFSGVVYARYMATYSMCFPIMLAIAPVLGAHLFQTFGWESNFLFLTICATLLGAFFYFKLPETNTKNKDSLNWKNLGKNIAKLLKDKNFLSLSLGHGLPVTMAAIYSVNSAFIFITGFGYDPDDYAYVQLIPVGFNLIGSWLFRHHVVKWGISKSLRYSLYMCMVFASCCLLSLFFKNAQLPVPILITMSVLNLTLSACISGCGTLALDYDNNQRGLAVAVLGFFRNGVVAMITLLVGIFFDGSIIPVYISMILLTLALLYATWPYAYGRTR